jgi:shikimate dehydrogenase
MTITGRTRLCAILADPVHQVRTPETFNRLMGEWGVDAVMAPMHVPAPDLTTAVAALRGFRNLAGFIATVPHKMAVVALCDEVSPAARAAGAVNTVRREADGRLVGEILDGVGFVRGLQAAGVEIAGRRVFLAGAGGAGSAIAFALAQAGAAELGVYNRTASKAAELRDRLRPHFPATPVTLVGPDPAGFGVVVNSTSLGLSPDDPLPFEAERLTAAQTVAEVIMKPAMTPLLTLAAARGCRICLGDAMLDHQLALMAEFMGLKP